MPSEWFPTIYETNRDITVEKLTLKAEAFLRLDVADPSRSAAGAVLEIVVNDEPCGAPNSYDLTRDEAAALADAITRYLREFHATTRRGP